MCPYILIFDRILLAGDGWWAEPDIGEWLWVGDYIWRKGERAGRVTLAAAIEIGGARWVILGDNSPLLNSQLYADPRAAVRIVEMATLWPSFAKDIFGCPVCFCSFLGLLETAAQQMADSQFGITNQCCNCLDARWERRVARLLCWKVRI